MNYKSKADKNFVQNMVASGTPIGEVADMIGLTPRRASLILSAEEARLMLNVVFS